MTGRPESKWRRRAVWSSQLALIPCQSHCRMSVVSCQGVERNSQIPALQDSLKGLSLEQLGNIEVTSVSKSPVSVVRTPAAVYVITQQDIRRSGATNLPEALRMAPGVEVAQIDGVKWAVGIRGFEGRLSWPALVLIDGRSVYDPLFHGVYWEVQDTLMGRHRTDQKSSAARAAPFGDQTRSMA